MTLEGIIAEFRRTTQEVFSLDRFRAKLALGRPLRIKYGVDVTAPFLHIGHAVNLWMMRHLQDQGHKVIFLIGDFTTRIGDPTGRSDTRPVLPREEIEKNAQEFLRQVRMVLLDDPEVFEVRRNSEWFENMPTGEFLGLLSMVTHARLLSRDMFQKRIQEERDIFMHELIYPLLQGYDSYALASDLTIIGSDQLFNEMMGCFYQEKLGQEPQVVITTQITPGIDGKAKQSKSLGNYVALGHSPRDKFGRIMRVPDDLIRRYFEVYTALPLDEIERIVSSSANPMAAKKRLAAEIVTRYHGSACAREELDWFESVFSQKQIPDDIPVVTWTTPEGRAFDVLRACFPVSEMSNGQLRRLFEQGGVSLENEKLASETVLNLTSGDVVVKAGKRAWFRIRQEPA